MVGVPTVGTAVGQIADWAPQAALAAPVGDAGMLARHVAALLGDEELRLRVQGALARLEAPDREVLLLRYFEQLSTQETAAVLGLSDSGVKSRLMRALVRLRELVDEREGRA